jgi:hypothetical protein
MKEIQFSIGLHQPSGRLLHINEVVKGSNDSYFCPGCQSALTPVKGEMRQQHFRHLADIYPHSCRSNALHEYAVQIIKENKQIRIRNNLTVDYTATEIKKRVITDASYIESDIAIQYEEEHIYVEVVVTHDMDMAKTDVYKDRQLKCLRIDLSDSSFLTMPPEKIKEHVLTNISIRNVIYWDEPVAVVVEKTKDAPTEFSEQALTWLYRLGIGLIVFLGIRALVNNYRRRHKKYHKK